MKEGFPTSPEQFPGDDEIYKHETDDSGGAESHFEKEDFDIPETEKIVAASVEEARTFVEKYQAQYGEFHLVRIDENNEPSETLLVRTADEIPPSFFEGGGEVVVRINTDSRI